MDKQKWAIGTLAALTVFYLADSRLFSKVFPGEIIPNNYQFKLFRREIQRKPVISKKQIKEVKRKHD